MILGFISLLLTFGQSYIANICIPTKYGYTMLPCELRSIESGEEIVEGGGTEHHRRLLYFNRRFLSGDVQADCEPVIYHMLLVYILNLFMV